MRSYDWPRSLLVELANVLESMADGFIALDGDFRITLMNAAAERLYGVTGESAIGKTYWEAFPAALGTAIERELIRALAERVTIRGLVNQEPGGRWVEVDVHPVQNGGLALYCRDITERKRADEALHKSEERFRGYFELGRVGMAITSPTSGCLDVNDEICRMLGYERDELLRLSWAELTHPDDLAADVTQYNRVLAGEIDGYVLDKRFLRKDGQVVYAMISVKCVRRQDRSVDCFVGLLHDISERKLAEEKLKTSGSLLAEAQQIAHLGSWSWDIRTDAVTWSDECFRLFGLTPQEGEMSYEHGVDHVHPDDREMLRSKVEQALIDHQPFECSCRALQQDGTVRFAQSRGRVVLNEQGEPVRMFGILQDITERKLAEEALRESEKSLAAELFGMARLQELSTRLIQAGDSSALLQEVVDAAIAITSADRGSVNLLDGGSDTLVIAASRGFEPPFLDFFSTVQEGQGACGRAIQERARVVIDDVTSSPVFAGKPALEVVLTSGVRAVQSTPLISRSGRVVGVLSTHWNRPHEPAARELRLLDLLARQASDLIERHLAQAERDGLLESERQARAEAERQARLKDEFLATLSHELRTPLSARPEGARRGGRSRFSANHAVDPRTSPGSGSHRPECHGRLGGPGERYLRRPAE